jgi:large subunit ribosomal protein L9
MQVVLLERVEKLGQMGDVVKVKNGFARNFLLPKKKALRATKANLAFFETQRAQLEARNLDRKKDAEAVAKKLDGKSFIMLRQSSDRGHLYGSVTPRDIAAVVTEGGFEIARGQVRLDKRIKENGSYPLQVVLHPEVGVTVTINIARTEEEAERLARGEIVLSETTVEEENLAAAEAVFEEGAEPKAEEGEAEEPAKAS